MSEKQLTTNSQNPSPWIALGVILLLTPLWLRLSGRIIWCECGQVKVWSGDVWSLHNSQHLFDPYSFSHMLHGIIILGVLNVCFKKLSMPWKFTLATLIEASWEILENSKLIIDRYREATMALGYEGDSIINSMGDLLSCAIGFMIAKYLGLYRSIAVFLITEFVMLFWIKDNLTLNVIMLIYPIEAIKKWQMG